MKLRIVSVGVIMALASLLLMSQVHYVQSFDGLFDGFVRISAGGFGDSMNNYAWSMAYFGGDLYVGTGRNIPYMLGLALKVGGIIPWSTTITAVTHPEGLPPPPYGPDPDPIKPGNQYAPDHAEVIKWSEDMRAEIWRYSSGAWELAHKAQTFVNPINKYTYPEGIGYRIMTTFKGAIYAGVGSGFGRTLLVMSITGEHWLAVNTASLPFPSDTRALTVHNGKLYLGLGTVGEIYASSNPQPIPGADTWEKVVDFEDSAPGNTAVLSLVSFDGYLYAATQNINSGFEVWRSNARAPANPTDEWTRVVFGGAGDAWNVWGGTMNTFNDNLYVGSMSLPIPPLGLKGFDLIRIDTEDNWDLIVGNYQPSAPTVPRGSPLSGWPSGFGNPFNLYCWQLEEHCGILHLGTFDASSLLRFIPPDLIQSLPALNQETIASMIAELRSSGIDEAYVDQMLAILQEIDLGTLIQKLGQHLGGADMWISPNGLYWFPLSLNGFNDPNNYGFRTVVSTPCGLYVGTANPFEGCQVWVGCCKTGFSLVTDSNYCLFDTDTQTCGQQFKLIFTMDPANPGYYQLTASNPGQFYYNVFYLGCLEQGDEFKIELPYPFVTKGATPVHVYSSLRIEPCGCFIPCHDITSQFTVDPPTISLNAYDPCDTAEITVTSNCKYVGFLYIAIHVDYGLKKTGGYGRNYCDDATHLTTVSGVTTSQVIIENYHDYEFKVVFPGGCTNVRTIENMNVFKRNSGFAGIITDSSSNIPIKDAEVKIYKGGTASGNPLTTLKTDEDGFYFCPYKHIGKAAPYTITASAANHVLQTKTITVKANQFVLVNFELVPSP